MKAYISPKTVLSTAVFWLITLSTIHGQSVKCDETIASVQNKPAPELSVITEQDYPHLLNLSGLKKYSNVRYDIKMDKNSMYRLDGKGKNSSLYAVYGKDGNLITATYITKNSLLPLNIYHQLADKHIGWTMTANKMTVTDFDTKTTEYEVKMKKDKKKQTLFFDYSGNQITQLATKAK